MQHKIMVAMARRIKNRPSGKSGSWIAIDSAYVVASLREELAKLSEADALSALIQEPFVLNASQAAQWLGKNGFIDRPKRGSKSDGSAVEAMKAALAEA